MGRAIQDNGGSEVDRCEVEIWWGAVQYVCGADVSGNRENARNEKRGGSWISLENCKKDADRAYPKG